MKKVHLIAFSNDVLAIVITIMAVQLKAPESPTLAALWAEYPKLLSHVLSFVYLGIFWVNQHHLLESAGEIDRTGVWANLHLLFWLSLIPLAGGWFGKNLGDSVPVAAYGGILLMSAVAYLILSHLLRRYDQGQSLLRTALGRNLKCWLSILFYLVAIPLAFVWPVGSCAIYVLVAAVWLIPDWRVERQVETERTD